MTSGRPAPEAPPRLRPAPWEAALDAVGARLGLVPSPGGFTRLAAYSVAAFALLAAYPAVFSPTRRFPAVREAVGWGCALVLPFLHGQGQRLLREAPGTRRAWVLGAFPALAAAAFLAGPFHSTDVYAYANSGWLEARYGLDPYAHVVRDVPGWRADPLFTEAWAATVTPYGFLFAHAAAGLAWLGHGSLARTVAAFQAVNVLALAALGAFLVAAHRRRGGRAADLALHALLWSPFLLVHDVANAHNDLWMGLLVVAALRLAANGRWLWAPAAVAAAVLVKLAAAAVLPFVVVFLARRCGARRTVAGLAVGLLAAALISLPYALDAGDFLWSGIAKGVSDPSYSLAASLVGGYQALARALPRLGPSVDGFQHATQALFAAGFLVFWVRRAARAARNAAYGEDDLVADAVLSTVALVCVASARGAPWYPAMFLPAALLLPDGHPLRRLSTSLATFSLLSLTFVGRARILDAIVMTGVPLALAAWAARRARADAALAAPAVS